MNDNEYLETMAQLKFIGSVGDDQFLNTTTGKVENKNIYTTAVRGVFYRQETGKSSAAYCCNVIARSLKLLDKYKNIQGADEFVNIIRQYILEAKEGITHLKNTHKDNNLAYALFDIAIVTINQRLK